MSQDKHSNDAEPKVRELPSYWKLRGVTVEQWDRETTWLEERRKMGVEESFFRMAARLLRLVPQDWDMLSPAFFHAVIGLERALRSHYKAPDEMYTGPGALDPFRDLLQKALSEGLINDELFKDAIVVPDPDAFLLDYANEGYAKRLVEKLPVLRNSYFHGQMILSPEFFQLTLHLRRIVDVLKTSPVRTLID